MAEEGRAQTPIDAFLLRSLEARGLKPVPEAGRRELIRRLTFDLIGLPPAPEEVDLFVRDRSEDAYERLVDRLLASPQYGVRWARWWLDLARYGESNGFEFDEFRPSSWRYRDWVVGAFNRDMPYDEFARLQIAGDVLRPEDAGAVEATGFLVAGAYDTAGQNQVSRAMRAVVRADELEDLIGTVSQTFLGLTVHCARCHDHKFDPIRQAEYYRFASALEGVRHGEVDLTEILPETIERRSRIAAIEAEVAAIEAPARAKLLGETAGKVRPIPPSPMAAWDFAEGGKDRVGHADVALQGGASLSAEGLVLDGKSAHAITPPLGVELKEKTLEAWVRLEGTDQRGGGVLSVLEESGPFDAIVFGEVEPRPLDGRQRELRQDVGRGRGRRGRSRKAVRPRRHPLFRRRDDPALPRRPAVREGVSVRGSGRLPGGAEPAGVRHPASSRRRQPDAARDDRAGQAV